MLSMGIFSINYLMLFCWVFYDGNFPLKQKRKHTLSYAIWWPNKLEPYNYTVSMRKAFAIAENVNVSFLELAPLPLYYLLICSFEYITHYTGSAEVLNLMVSGFLEGKIRKFGLGMRGHWL